MATRTLTLRAQYKRKKAGPGSAAEVTVEFDWATETARRTAVREFTEGCKLAKQWARGEWDPDDLDARDYSPAL